MSSASRKPPTDRHLPAAGAERDGSSPSQTAAAAARLDRPLFDAARPVFPMDPVPDEFFEAMVSW